MTETSRLGIIAGGGDLPARLAQHAQSTGRNPYVLGVEGFASSDLVDQYQGASAAIGEIGKQITLLKKAGCQDLVFAGIVRRPDFNKLRLDFKGVRTLPAIVAAAGKGDDALLRAVVNVFEDEGFNVIGADDVFGGLLAKPGALGKHAPSNEQMDDIRLALEVVRRLGELDIGQAAVVRQGVVLAVEAQEGTDAMLARCETMPPLDKQPAGVLVKAPKPIQERRIDLPTIGPQTIERLLAAKLAGVAVEADGALIVDREEVVRLADEAGLFVFGIDPGRPE